MSKLNITRKIYSSYGSLLGYNVNDLKLTYESLILEVNLIHTHSVVIIFCLYCSLEGTQVKITKKS